MAHTKKTRMWQVFRCCRGRRIHGKILDAHTPQDYKDVQRLLDKDEAQLPVECVDTVVDRCFQLWRVPNEVLHTPLFQLLCMALAAYPGEVLQRFCHCQPSVANVTSCWDEFAKAVTCGVSVATENLLLTVSEVVGEAPVPTQFQEGPWPVLGFTGKAICDIANTLSSESPLAAWKLAQSVIEKLTGRQLVRKLARR